MAGLIQQCSGVPHLRRSFIAAKVGFALCATVLLLAAVTKAAAQSAPCGLSSVTETTQLEYPPIARAAHVQGPVVLMVTFEHDGTVSVVRIVSAPLLLDQLMGKIAATYVKGWRVNSFTGPRECPITIDFALGGEVEKPKVSVVRTDVQHVRITAETYIPTINYSVISTR